MSLAIFSSIGIWEILILVVVLLLLFGSKRLPQMGRSLGHGLREFKDSVSDSGRELKQAISETPGEIKSGLEGEEADPVAEQAVAQQALPGEGRTVEAPVATPVANGQQADGQSG
jgi:sec-independent protein translocase protein TatA